MQEIYIRLIVRKLIVTAFFLVVLSSYLFFSACKMDRVRPYQDCIITLDLKREKLSSVLTEIEKLSGVSFVYSSQLIKSDRLVNIHAREESLAVLLNNLLGPLEIKFRQEDEHFILVRQNLNPRSIKRLPEFQR